VVNAARVSFAKESQEFTEADERLLDYLAKNGHTSPFRHAAIGFEIYAPLMVARQWWKHVVGAPFVDTGWNESSRRYVTEDPEFYVPSEWRKAPENRKQGSAEAFDPEDKLESLVINTMNRLAAETIHRAQTAYDFAIANGVAVEQARLLLPAYGLYIRWRWFPTLQAVAHFTDLRLGHDAQSEIRDYAVVVDELAVEAFPYAYEALRRNR
jgi:thymidylate synthase (FAD)